MKKSDSQVHEYHNGKNGHLSATNTVMKAKARQGISAHTADPAQEVRSQAAEPISGLEWLCLTAVASLVLTGWGALILAQWGRLTFVPLLGVITLSLGVSLGGMGLALWWTPCSPARQAAMRDPLRVVHNLAVVVLLGLAALLYTPPADYALAFLDAGWYTNAGALIARTGQLTVQPEILETVPPTARRLFIRTYQDLKASMPQFPERSDVGFFNLIFAVDQTRDGAIGPYHPPFLSVWVAIGHLLTQQGGNYVAPLFGVLFVWAVYAAGRALLGPNVALVSAVLTALSPAVVYYARTPFAELLAGALIWAGVCALVRGQMVTRPVTHLAGRSLALRQEAAGLMWVVVAGLAFGAALFTKFEGFLLLLPLTLFWGCALRWNWFSFRAFGIFVGVYGLMLAHALWLYGTVLRPYTLLNVYGLGSSLRAMMDRPTAWLVVTIGYAGVMVALVVLRSSRRLSGRFLLWARVSPGRSIFRLPTGPQGADPALAWQEAGPSVRGWLALAPSLRSILLRGEPGRGFWEVVSLAILLGAGLALLHPGASLTVLHLFMTPLGVTLGLVGFSLLVADELNRRTALLGWLVSTVGLVTVILPAISTDVSYLYTVRRQLPVVMPALFLLTSYVTLRWAGLVGPQLAFPSGPAGMKRGISLVLLSLLAINFFTTSWPLARVQEFAGASRFLAQMAGRFTGQDVVLFESVDRGAHVGRFAAPLWARHGISALLLSSTYPPLEPLEALIERWQQEGRRIYFVTQSQQPPFPSQRIQWHLVDKPYWAGATIAARMTFPPATWVIEIPLYIWESDPAPSAP